MQNNMEVNSSENNKMLFEFVNRTEENANGENVHVTEEHVRGCEKNNQQWSVLLIVTSFATTIGTAVPVGYCLGALNNPAQLILNWSAEAINAHYNVELENAQLNLLLSLFVSIFLASAAVSSLTGASAANRLGRKNCILLCGLLLFVGGFMFLNCRRFISIEMFLLGRILVGVAAGLTTSVLPMYLTEIAPLAVRGTMGVFCAVGVTAGVVVGQVFTLSEIFGTDDYWHIGLSFYLLLLSVCFLPAYYFPESPKYLYVVLGDHKSALESLKRLRAGQQIKLLEQEIYEMDTEVKNQPPPKSFAAVLRDPEMLLPLVITCAYQAGQQLSGINAIFYYSIIIFQRAGLSISAARWANLGAGCLNLATSLLSTWLMAKFNRRPLMMFSCALCSMFLLSVSFFLQYISSVEWFAYACICCVMGYIFFFQFGLGPIPYFIGTELFDIQPRPVAMSMGSLSSWLGNFIVGMCFTSLEQSMGALVFLPFSFTCALLFLLTKFYLPETRGRDTSQVARLVSKGFKSKVLK